MKPHRIIPYEEAKAQALIAKRIALNNGQPEIVKAIHQLGEAADNEITRIREAADALMEWKMPEIEEGYEGFDKDWRRLERVLAINGTEKPDETT